ncbi:MAG: B12-binding domain-containing radical SAM protein [Lentisphaerae bacterium]|nr:B12-binding domain-containing radical SAM protein [Lentisphaerota bacterium]
MPSSSPVILVTFAFIPEHNRVHHGLAAISGYLKARDIPVELVVVDRDDPPHFARQILAHNPLWAGFTVIYNYWNAINALAAELKRQAPGLPLILGGKGVISAPDLFLLAPAFELLCLFEGERVAHELTARLRERQPIDTIPGTWARQHRGPIVKNAGQPAEEDLDALGMPDYTIFGETVFKAYQCFAFSRGCPYDCSYCANAAIRRLGGAALARVRRKSVAHALEEIRHVSRLYRADFLAFDDETFLADKAWTRDFLEQYRRTVRLPFHCQTRPETLTAEMAHRLADAGCRALNIGIESGNDRIRSKLLNRKLSRKKICDAFTLAHQAGLQPVSFNILGLPSETFDAFLDTIDLNAEARPANTQLSTFYPYPGTPLGDECRKQGWVRGDNVSFMQDSVLNLDTFPPDDMRKARWWFNVGTLSWYAANHPSSGLDWSHANRPLPGPARICLCIPAASADLLPWVARGVMAAAHAFGRPIPCIVLLPGIPEDAKLLARRYPHLTFLDRQQTSREALLSAVTAGGADFLCPIGPYEWIGPDAEWILEQQQVPAGAVVHAPEIVYAEKSGDRPGLQASPVGSIDDRPTLFPVALLKNIELTALDSAAAMIHACLAWASKGSARPPRFTLATPLLFGDTSLMSKQTGSDFRVTPIEPTVPLSSEAELLEAYFEQLVRAARAESSPFEGFALYGAGKHTRWLVGVLSRRDLKPTVIFDDQPQQTHVDEIPVVPTADLDRYTLSFILISSDSAHNAMAAKLAPLVRSRALRVINPYEHLHHAPYAKS